MIKYNIIKLKKEGVVQGTYNLKEDDFNIVQELIKVLVKKYSK